MNALLESFLDYISLERGLSINTRKAYADDIGQLLNELTAKGISSLNQVSRKQILDHLMAMKARDMSTNSISRHLVSIKVFFRYLQQEGMLDRNVTDTMDSPKLWKILPDTLSEKEVDLLLGLTRNEIREALHFCREAVSLEGYNPDLRCNLGRVLMRAGRRKEAHQSFQRGLNLQADHPGLVRAVRRLGVRQRPVLPFLARGNALNVFLGKIRAPQPVILSRCA